jgi:hypothetical protein
MTTDVMTNYVKQRPFVPFTMILANGREVHVPHSDFVVGGRSVLTVSVLLPTGQPETIDTDLIVSIRTFHPAELPES